MQGRTDKNKILKELKDKFNQLLRLINIIYNRNIKIIIRQMILMKKPQILMIQI